jgi:TolA-binding protein
MLSIKNAFKFVSISFFIASIALTGCSYLPWSDNKDEDEDLFFEEDFGSEFENVPSADKGKEKEDDFFKNDKQMAQSKPVTDPPPQAVPSAPDEEDFFFEEDEPKAEPAPRPAPRPMSQPQKKMEQESVDRDRSGFASVDQKTDKAELKVDVAALQSQQEELMFRVQELQKIVNNLEPRLTATQERVDASLSTGAGSPAVTAEIQSLKAEIIRLNSEISTLKGTPTLKKTRAPSKPTQMARKSSSMRRHLKASKTPKEYNQALAAYKAGKYDESILLFQEMSLGNPPQNLKDNIVFWMGSNYLKLDMHDDAIKQFQAVLTQYPNGNKVHDARYMLGVSYQKKGDTGRALDALEMALKNNPPSEVRKKIEKQLMEIK